MSDVFGDLYSSSYDTLYREKDYGIECDFIERAIASHGQPGERRIIDLGCGTGSHALELGRRGYAVHGVDRSEHMLKAARAKHAENPGLKLTFQQSDLLDVQAGTNFDAAVMMFAVLGYISDPQALNRALANVRRHLRPGALFIADFWYGPAVLTQRPGERVRVIELPGRTIVRATRTDLDTLEQSGHVHFTLFEIADGKPLRQTRETHVMRFFFPQEIAALLRFAGFELKTICAFPALDRAPTDADWNAAIVAQAV